MWVSGSGRSGWTAGLQSSWKVGRVGLGALVLGERPFTGTGGPNVHRTDMED